MKVYKKVVFCFDEKSYENLDKLIKQGRIPSGYSTNPDDYQEIKILIPSTNQSRIIVIPKNASHLR